MVNLRKLVKAVFRTSIMGLILLLPVKNIDAASSGGMAQEQENQLKAALLMKFVEHVEWPDAALPQPNTPISVCVVGEASFGGELETMSGRDLNGRSVMVTFLETAHSMADCSVLFVSSSEASRQEEVLQALANSPVLTVGETDGFLKAGGIIEFVRRNNRMRYDINPLLAADVGLQLDPVLLEYARKSVAKR